MTTKTEVQTLETASAERDRLAAAARAAGEIADKLAAERFEVLTAKRQSWARSVMADQAAIAATLATAERAAARAFQVAAVDGDARLAFLSWCDSRNEVNVHRDRVGAARAALGEAEADAAYVFRDVPSYSVELDRALASEASSRWSDRQSEFQAELNALDVVT